jgi:putative transposase
MAETSLSPEEFLSKFLSDEHADVLREGLAWLVRELMESEVAGQTGAALHEKGPQRLTRRNGYRERLWQTHVGDLDLAIPRLRSGSYFLSFLEHLVPRWISHGLPLSSG